MKKILLLTFFLIFGTQLFAQDPNLYRTWYLYSVMDSDLGNEYIVAEINPPIYPFITITETSDPETAEINGQGACNTFNGLYTVNATNYEAMEFTKTDEDCGYEIHNSFEYGFFNFMSGLGSYQINSDNQGMTLVMLNPLMGDALFKDYPLSLVENTAVDFKIYPIPATETLYITSEKHIDEINVYSINGQLMYSKKNNSTSLDVSEFSKGTYFLEITSGKKKGFRNS